MTTLLTFRDNVKAFLGRYDYIITPVLKFFLSLILFYTLNNQFGYMKLLNNGVLLLLLALVCAFLPVEILTGIGGVMIAIQSMCVSLDVGIASVAVILIFYCAYMRFVPKTGVIVLLVPLFYLGHGIYALPILLGILVGPLAIVPAAFGVVLYYYENLLKDLSNVLATSTEEEEAVQGFQYIMTRLLENKTLLLSCVVFACVILVTFLTYRLFSGRYWIISFFFGGFLNVVLFLVGSVTLSIEMEIVPILVGSLVGILAAVVVQFGKGIADYQKTEILHFEDDEYYYYVKAIPKLSVSESNKNVKHINSKTRN